MKHPIAIVGIGCRFAGAPDVHAYWRLTVEGRDAFGPVPPDRWTHEQFFDANPRATDKSYAPNGAFIDDVRSFPALALGIPPRRVEVMDPQQRQSILVAREAIQDAGYRTADLPRRTGVYMGVTASEWRTLLGGRVVAQLMASGDLGEAPASLDDVAAAVQNIVPSRPFSAPGALANMIAAAVAQELDLHGPAFTMDAACASGMVAVENAVLALRAGTIDCAVAGGVYLALSPENHIAFSRIGAISRSGVCRPFDARADGFVQGDGAGALVLKRLEDAERDGDRIYAVVSGIASNNDGRGDGPMAPVREGQVEAIRRAWDDAGSDRAQVGYVETHGTGTSVGDQTEFTGLMEALGDAATHTALGSSKGNVGHTMSAAGIAGLVRTALAIHHGTVPPMAGFEAAKDTLGLDDSPFYVPVEAVTWEGPRVGCVSSFGFGGTNVHAVLEGVSAPAEAHVPQAELLLWSARDDAALRTTAADIASALRAGASVASVARTLAPRTPMAHRAALVADDRDTAIRELEAFAGGGEHDVRTGESAAPANLALLFPGQGAQRVGMLADSRKRFPILEQTLAEVDHTLDLPVPITALLDPSLRDEPVSAEEADRAITDTAACQPVLYACSLGLQRLLTQVGVEFMAATGHSLGEFNAAVAGGVISAEDAARFVTARGRGMAAVTGDTGAMAAVMSDRDTVQDLVVDGVVLANINHPRQVVISGTTDGVRTVAEKARERGITAKPLTVSHAFHSPIFADLDANAWLEGIELQDPGIVVASGIDKQPYRDADAARDVFLRHTRSPVDFVGALHQVVESGADLLLQVGAGGPLASFARGTVGDRVRGVQTLGKRRDDDRGTGILEGLGWLWCNGVDLDVRPITADAPVASLPPEQLPSEVYWAIKDKRQKSLKLKATAPASVVDTPQQAQEATTPAAPTEQVDQDQQKVFAVVAKVSAYPLDALKPTMRLVDDLGFDSLMVGDMATGLAEAFPGLGGIPQELLINSPTVQDLIDFVKTAGEAVEVDDDAPLTAFAPTWTPAARLGDAGRDTRGHIAWLDEGLAPVAAALAARGVECTTDRTEPADLIVWSARGDRSGELAALLADQIDRGNTPDVIVLADPADTAAEADAGLVRAYGAEQEVVAKVLWGDALDEVVAEWLDAERTVDVHFANEERAIRTFAPAPTVDRAPLGADDTVLITGGTRGIGLKLAHRLVARGCQVVLMARSAVDVPGMPSVQANVVDRDAVVQALAGHRITAVVHAAGVLADGPIESVDPAVGARARSVKIDGLDNLLHACPDARVVLGIGSWAGRFGNRHQAHYAAGNAGMAGRAMGSDRVVVSEFGPWTDSDMVRTIPSAIQATMRSEGVDFVGDEAGLNALLADLDHGVGVRTHGREMPRTTRAVHQTLTLSTDTHPYLLDHAIEGTPVLPLAGATDLMATAAGPTTPFEVVDLRLYQGIAVTEPVTLTVRVRGDRAEIRTGSRNTLAYRARIRALETTPSIPTAPEGGDAPTLPLADFYADGTFHGPLLQGITAIDAVGPTFVRGRVRRGTPSDWAPSDDRSSFTVDPLALDSAMQLSGYVALTRFERAGTPVGIGRLVQLAPLPEEMLAEVHFGDREDDRFAGTIVLRDLDGTPVLLAEETVAELRKLAPDDLGDFEAKPEWVDFSQLPGLKELDMRLQMAELGGIRNPYFSVHDGTARDTTSIAGQELINFSSYNYIGLSGDPRVVAATQEAVARYGTSVSASRVASGERPFHQELERLISEAQDVEDALVFTAGHATNVTTIGHLMGPGDLVLHDELIHDSALQGIKLAGCARRGFKHDDPADLEAQLKELRPHYEKVLIVVEGVYSMDGDIADLPSYIALKRKYQCLLMCDEAHSFGVVGANGRGVHEHFGFPGSDVDIWMGTLSKSVSSCGGWIGGSKDLIRYLRYTAPGFIYSAGITAANGVAAVESLKLMLAEPWRVEKLQANCQHFHDELVARGIDTGPAKGGSAVIPTITGNSLHALLLSQRLADAGINAQPIVYPAVADDAARLRFFLSSTHSFEQLTHTANEVARLLAGIREEFPAPP